MKKLFLLIALMMLIVACSPAQTTLPVVEPTPTNVAPAPAPTPIPTSQPAAPDAGITSNIGGKAPTQGGLLPTGNTKNFLLTVTAEGYSTKVLTVIPGDRIKLTVINEDTKEHSFSLPDFGVTVTVAPDDSGLVDFTPLKKGEFSWTDMGTKAGTLIVGGST